MGRLIVLLGAVLVVAGCSGTGTINGSGLTNRNETITAVAVRTGPESEYFDLISNTGWSCRGVMTAEQARQMTGSITVPLNCDDGRTGTSRLTVELWQGQINGQFSLSDGTTGTVIFNAVQ